MIYLVLKHPQARSTFEEMGLDSQFNPLLVHHVNGQNLESVETVIFCTGKINYDMRALLSKTPAETQSKIAIFVVEELLPFPEQVIKEKLSGVNKSANVKEFYVRFD